MKKALALILTLALCLSLAACGKKESSNPDSSPSQETILKEASAIDLDAVGNAFEKNAVNAQETYYDDYYTIVGTVRRIETEKVAITPITAVFGGGVGSASYCYVELSTDDIKSLTTDTVIEVCGKLTDFKRNYDSYNLTLSEAFYVGNTIEVNDAEVSDIKNYVGGKKSIVLKQGVLNGTSFGNIFYEIVVAESGAENSEVAEFMGKTYQVGDKVSFTGSLYNSGNNGSNYYNATSIKTISKK